MTAVRHDVHHPIDVQVCGPGAGSTDRTLPFIYDRDQPYEVTILIAGHGRVERIVLSRAELDSGRYKTVQRPGADTMTFPDGYDRRWMYIGIRPGCGHFAMLKLAVVDVSAFLDPTYDLVPAGTEADHQLVPDDAQMDAALAAWLGAA
ncbi:SsgA family sporulation/cell division regulator [Dactylosporangium sucinum]|uniref:Uncharacterized protein n=1 Tax=Dactylosporangium sucinum TaxID=1424081 RepID=A0A917U2R0_9ACTN|nr:SsgA family sporulation/cell division regulator [Dactylosporangium sucinum]GGM53858.1 hypothetical protein GCM10007977_064310 [Dactylosporangium sucinum]